MTSLMMVEDASRDLGNTFYNNKLQYYIPVHILLSLQYNTTVYTINI